MAKAKKTSSRVLLTTEQLQSLKDAIVAGESTKSIHERLGVSIANISYHKGELKKKGLLIIKKSADNEVVKKASLKKAKPVSKVSTINKETTKPKEFMLIVNGVSVHIEGAGFVSVGENYIKVDF